MTATRRALQQQVRDPRFLELDRLIAMEPETGRRFKPAAPRPTAAERRAEYLKATGRAA